MTKLKFLLIISLLQPGWDSLAQSPAAKLNLPKMYYGDTSRTGLSVAKDPHVVWFKDKYLMYYSIPGNKASKSPIGGWGMGIAESKDLIHWQKTGEITPDAQAEYEKNGLTAPSAIVLANKVHLFYQTYGNWTKDAICHAVSEDGIHFKRNVTNPIFRPTGKWTSGRAIDAEIFKADDKFLLYFATRDSTMKNQIVGVASAPLTTDFKRSDWTQLTDYPILKAEYPWEETCIEGPSIIKRGDWLYMFYGGAYNNRPQQIGVARSKDGIKWEKLSNKPLVENGDPGSWNYSESGHPHIFTDKNNRTYLFYQGNNDNGKTWYLSNLEVLWTKNGPYLK